MKTQFLSLLILFFVTSSLYAQEENDVTAFTQAPFQFTFITPPISTNGTNFYNTINDISINTFLGVGAASNYVELGGFVNANRLYANGVQLAGFANINGFDPLAAAYNSRGIQLSGFLNYNGAAHYGLQGAGFANVGKSIEGLQASGFMNANQEARNSVLAAGFLNYNKQIENTFEFAGFANVSPTGKTRMQAAGFLNVAPDLKGIQASGFANKANNVEGVQAAGFINVAGNVKGLQLAGFINVCDSIDGIPISFISIVKKNGYRNFEISTSEWSPVQLTYRMGVEKFYNVYSLSKLNDGWDSYAFGFGFGHNRNIMEKTDLNIELVQHYELLVRPNLVSFVSDRTNTLSQLKVGVRRNVIGDVWVNAGPTLNLSWAYNNSNSATNSNDIQPYLWKVEPRTFADFENWNGRFWLGFHAGISFR